MLALALAACAEVELDGSPDPALPVAAEAGAAAEAGRVEGSHAGGDHVDAGHGGEAGPEHDHGPACASAGVDGLAPGCRFFAACAIGEVEVACDAATETCTCTPASAGAPASVAYDPAFCAVGAAFPAANLAAAARACRWSF